MGQLGKARQRLVDEKERPGGRRDSMGIAAAHRQVLAAVWERDVGNHVLTTCDCCEESLHYNDAILGHIIAKTFLSEEEVRGATTLQEIDDICLLCRDCNARMGIRQVYDWKREMLQKVVTPEQEERERRAIAWKARYLSGRV